MGDKQGTDDAPDFSFLGVTEEPDLSAIDFNFGGLPETPPTHIDLSNVNVEAPEVPDPAVTAAPVIAETSLKESKPPGPSQAGSIPAPPKNEATDNTMQKPTPSVVASVDTTAPARPVATPVAPVKKVAANPVATKPVATRAVAPTAATPATPQKIASQKAGPQKAGAQQPAVTTPSAVPAVTLAATPTTDVSAGKPQGDIQPSTAPKNPAAPGASRIVAAGPSLPKTVVPTLVAKAVPAGNRDAVKPTNIPVAPKPSSAPAPLVKSEKKPPPPGAPAVAAMTATDLAFAAAAEAKAVVSDIADIERHAGDSVAAESPPDSADYLEIDEADDVRSDDELAIERADDSYLRPADSDNSGAVSAEMESAPPEASAETLDQAPLNQVGPAPAGVSQRTFSIVAGYAATLTLLLAFLYLTGRASLTGTHPLESLPDIKPLQQNEFQRIPPEVGLPPGHSLKLGESQRFGDVILTPLRVTREPLRFTNMLTKAAAENLTTAPVLKLWFEVKNDESSGIAFPAWDVELMSHRSPPEGTDDETLASSWLVFRKPGDEQETRLLNYLHPPSSSFDIVDMHSRQPLRPGESVTTFIASSPEIMHVKDADQYRWRIQLRKGVNAESGNGVTTLVDIHFAHSDIAATPAG